MISAKLESPAANIKVIANGRVLDLDKPLGEQGVKNNKQIMALVTDVGETIEDPYARIRKIRSEAEVLLKNKNSGFLAVSFFYYPFSVILIPFDLILDRRSVG